MNSEGPGVGRPAEPAAASSLLAELKAQCERLQEVARELEEEKKRDAEALAAAEAELREYRRLLYDWAGKQVREQDWADFAEDDYTIPAEDVVAELDGQEGS